MQEPRRSQPSGRKKKKKSETKKALAKSAFLSEHMRKGKTKVGGGGKKKEIKRVFLNDTQRVFLNDTHFVFFNERMQ
jgi:hypothetical protein